MRPDVNSRISVSYQINCSVAARRKRMPLLSAHCQVTKTGTFRDFPQGSSKHLLYGGMAQVSNKGADCVLNTIIAAQPIFGEKKAFFLLFFK